MYKGTCLEVNDKGIIIGYPFFLAAATPEIISRLKILYENKEDRGADSRKMIRMSQGRASIALGRAKAREYSSMNLQTQMLAYISTVEGDVNENPGFLPFLIPDVFHTEAACDMS